MYVHGKSEHVLQKYKKVCHAMKKLSLLLLLFLLLQEKVTNKIIRRFSRALFSMYPI
jgi:hypothetical protein